MTPIYNMLHIALFRIIVGRRVIQQLLDRREQLVKYMHFLYAQILMMFIYPVYEVLFRFAEGSRFQLLVILLLPIIKVLIKNIVLRCTVHAEDIAPEAVIFTVDFFNAIYVATCMQSASSVYAIVAITVTDLSQTLIMLYGLRRQTINILPRPFQMVNASQDNDCATDLLNALSALCRDPDKFCKQTLTNVRKRSCFPHQLSAADASLLDVLSNVGQPTHSTVVVPSRKTSSVLSLDKFSRPRKLCFICTRHRSNSIHPHPPTTELVNLAVTAGVGDIRPTEKLSSQLLTTTESILRESLEVLFTMECLVVTAYLEAAIPFFYTLYMLVMVYLPSAPYHTEMNGVTHENVGSTVLPVFIFGLLQVVSFFMLVAVIKRNCGVQVIYHLTFVLEAQRSMIQGKLIIWMAITLCFRVVHFGVDFTFKFAGLEYHFQLGQLLLQLFDTKL